MSQRTQASVPGPADLAATGLSAAQVAQRVAVALPWLRGQLALVMLPTHHRAVGGGHGQAN